MEVVRLLEIHEKFTECEVSDAALVSRKRRFGDEQFGDVRRQGVGRRLREHLDFLVAWDGLDVPIAFHADDASTNRLNQLFETLVGLDAELA